MCDIKMYLLIVALLCSGALSLPIEERLSPNDLLQKILDADLHENNIKLDETNFENENIENLDGVGSKTPGSNVKPENERLVEVDIGDIYFDPLIKGTKIIPKVEEVQIKKGGDDKDQKSEKINEDFIKNDEDPAENDEETTSIDEKSVVNEEAPTQNEKVIKNDVESIKTDKEPTKIDEEPTKTDKEPTKTDEEPTKTDEEPTKTDEEPTTIVKEPIEIDEKPTNTDEESIKVDKDSINTDEDEIVQTTEDQIPPEQGNQSSNGEEEEVLSQNRRIIMPDEVHSLFENDKEQDRNETVSTQVDKIEDVQQQSENPLPHVIFDQVQEEENYGLEEPTVDDSILVPLDDLTPEIVAYDDDVATPDDYEFQPVEEDPLLLPLDTYPQDPDFFDDAANEELDEEPIQIEIPIEEDDQALLDDYEQKEQIEEDFQLTPLDILPQEPILSVDIPIAVIDEDDELEEPLVENPLLTPLDTLPQEPILSEDIPIVVFDEENEELEEPLVETPLLTPLDTLPQEPILSEDIPIVVFDEENEELEEPLVENPLITPLDTLPQEPILSEDIPIAVFDEENEELEEPLVENPLLTPLDTLPQEPILSEDIPIVVFDEENEELEEPFVENPLLTPLDTLPQEPSFMNEGPTEERLLLEDEEDETEPIIENPFFSGVDTPSQMEEFLAEESDMSNFPTEEESMMSSYGDFSTREFENPQEPILDMFSGEPNIPEELSVLENYDGPQEPMSQNRFFVPLDPFPQMQDFETIPSDDGPMFDAQNEESNIYGIMNSENMDNYQTFSQNYPATMEGQGTFMNEEGPMILINDNIPYGMFANSEDFPQNNFQISIPVMMDGRPKIIPNKLIPIMDESLGYFSGQNNYGMDESAPKRDEQNFSFDEGESLTSGDTDNFRYNPIMSISQDNSDSSMNLDSISVPFERPSPVVMKSFSNQQQERPLFMNYGPMGSSASESQQTKPQKEEFGVDDNDSEVYIPSYLNRNAYGVPQKHFQWRGVAQGAQQINRPNNFADESYNTPRNVWENLGYSGIPIVSRHPGIIEYQFPEPEIMIGYPKNQQIFGNTFKPRESSDKEETENGEEHFTDDSKVEDISSTFPSGNSQSSKNHPLESSFQSLSKILRSLTSFSPNLASNNPFQYPFDDGYQSIIIVLDPSSNMKDISGPSSIPTDVKTIAKSDGINNQDKSIMDTNPTMKNSEPTFKNVPKVKSPYIPNYPPIYSDNFEEIPHSSNGYPYQPYRGGFQSPYYTPEVEAYPTMSSKPYSYPSAYYGDHVKPYFRPNIFPQRGFNTRPDNLAHQVFY